MSAGGAPNLPCGPGARPLASKLVKLVGVLVVGLLGACVADDAAPDELGTVTSEFEVEPHDPDDPHDPHDAGELCTLADALPDTELCSLICDPDAFAARLRDAGMAAGNCYQVHCTLSPETSVTVGVCLL